MQEMETKANQGRQNFAFHLFSGCACQTATRTNDAKKKVVPNFSYYSSRYTLMFSPYNRVVSSKEQSQPKIARMTKVCSASCRQTLCVHYFSPEQKAGRKERIIAAVVVVADTCMRSFGYLDLHLFPMIRVWPKQHRFCRKKQFFCGRVAIRHSSLGVHTSISDDPWMTRTTTVDIGFAWSQKVVAQAINK